MPNEFGWDLAIGDVRGTRAWRLQGDWLTGINHPQVWYPGLRGWSSENRAVCLRADRNVCTGVEPRCTCGFYAYLRGINDYLAEFGGVGGPGEAVIGGTIRGWGKTVVGTRGFRTERAEILALYVSSMSWQIVEREVLYSIAGFQTTTDEIRELRPLPAVTVAHLQQRLGHIYHVPVFTDWKELLAEFPPTDPEVRKED